MITPAISGALVIAVARAAAQPAAVVNLAAVTLCVALFLLFASMTAFTLDAAVLALAHALALPRHCRWSLSRRLFARSTVPSLRLRPHMTADLLPMPPPNLPPPHHPCRHRPRRRSLSCAVRRSCTPGLSCAAGLATLQLALFPSLCALPGHYMQRPDLSQAKTDDTLGCIKFEHGAPQARKLTPHRPSL